MTWRTRRRGRLEAILVVALFAALLGLWRALGGRFEISYGLWQLLAAPELRDHLARSLFDLQSQPPLLNLLLGLILKLAAATGTAPESWAAPLLAGVGLGICLALCSLGRRLIGPAPVRWVAWALVVLNPLLYAELSHFFYTPFETFFLLLVVVAALRYLEAPAAGRLVRALVPALLLVHLRSFYHPAWLALVAAALLIAGRRRAGRAARLHAEIAALAVLLSLAWPAKNLFRFGFFGFSSWQGYNLASGLPLEPDPDFKRLFLRIDPLPPSAELEARARQFLGPEDRERPVLAEVAKPDGSPNWNHPMVLAQSRELGRLGREQFRRHPSWILQRAWDFYLRGFARYEGRDPYSDELAAGGLYADLRAAPGWARAYEAVAMQRFRPFQLEASGRVTTGFALLFPLLVLAPAILLWRRRRDLPPTGAAAGLALLLVLWNLALVCLVDGMEGNRMRFPVQPELLLAAGWAAGELARALRRTRDEKGSQGERLTNPSDFGSAGH